MSSLLASLAALLGGVVVLVALVAAAVVDRQKLAGVRREYRSRLRETWPYLLFLGAVLALNKVARDLGPELSWIVGWNITGDIFALEGHLVVRIQSIAAPALTALFSFLYLYGYVLLLVFPFVAYFSLSDQRYLKETAVAYGLNYAIGLTCYVLFISYGPRNLIPDLVEPLLYQSYPRAQLITSQVNSNTNVFPSLHASLSTTVAVAAWRTRGIYPRWPVVAVPVAVGVVVSTMYLGIHWATDVLAGVLLGAVSVWGSVKVVDRFG